MSVEDMEKAYKEKIRSLRKRISNSEPRRFVIPFSSILDNKHPTDLICDSEEYSREKYYKFKNILKSEILSH